MRSQLYECRVVHERLHPTIHRFVHPIFLFSIDLAELPALHRRLRLFSFNRRNLYSFRETDFLPVGNESSCYGGSDENASKTDRPTLLERRLRRWMAERGVNTSQISRIQLLTLPRVAGYLFNPVSFYFAFDRADQPIAVVAEVTNTFREVKPYLLDGRAFTSGRFRLRVAKDFYVSPFSDVDASFDFVIRPPDSRLAIRIDTLESGRRTLTSAMTGVAHALNDRALTWFTCKYPLVTLRTITLIHFHALQLYMRKTRWFPKAAKSEHQRDLHHPHRSIRKSSDPVQRACATREACATESFHS